MAEKLTRKQIAGAMALRKVKEVPKFGKEDVEQLRGLFKTELQSQVEPLEPLPEPTPFVPRTIEDEPSDNPIGWLVNRFKGNQARGEESKKLGRYKQAVANYRSRKDKIAAREKNKPMDEAVLAHEILRQKLGMDPGQMARYRPIDESQFQ